LSEETQVQQPEQPDDFLLNPPTEAPEAPEEKPDPVETAPEASEDAAEPTNGSGLPDDPDALKALLLDAQKQLHGSEKNRNQLYARLKETEQVSKRLEIFEKKFGSLEERLAAPPAPEEEPPDPDIDPLGATAFETKALAKKLDALTKTITDKSTREDQLAMVETYDDWIEASEEDFTDQEGFDYDDVEEFWTEKQIEKLDLFAGEEVDEDTATAQVTIAHYQLAKRAKQLGMTLPELKYRIALAEGYVPPDPDELGEEWEEDEEAAPAAPSKAAHQIAAARAKRDRSKSVSGSGTAQGGPKKGIKTWLADAKDQEEFNRRMFEIEKKYGKSANLDRLEEQGAVM